MDKNQKEIVFHAIKELTYQMYVLCHDDWENGELNKGEWFKWQDAIGKIVDYNNDFILEMERYYANPEDNGYGI